MIVRKPLSRKVGDAPVRAVRHFGRRRGVGPSLFLLAPFAIATIPALGRTDDSARPPATPVPMRIDINRADWPELMLLPGVGEMRARDIVRFRERRGGFHEVDDLDAVPGIGARSVERIRPFASVSAPSSNPGRHGDEE
ncbi:MAG: helix-hairpin-helix domain-containing protein [Planctomycetes bacterium]|nr:helix-hairpin-helix domain-containing protein [Planctomycetota bacterium]MBI3843101.1 helix-hairpin-helix domain-containing protein [Planctomycetota bacterium]